MSFFAWLCEGIVKTHRLLFIECDTVQAVFTKHLCPNVFTAQTRYCLLRTLEMHTELDNEYKTMINKLNPV